MVDLSPEHLQQVKKILNANVSNYEVRAFGSRVTGTAKPTSDLDLAVMSAKRIPIETFARLKEAFVESNLPFKVDVVDWADTSENFRRIIEGTSERIQ